MTDIDADRPLQNRCIATPKSHELDMFAALLERRGASVRLCPLVDIRYTPTPAPVLDGIGIRAPGGAKAARLAPLQCTRLA